MNISRRLPVRVNPDLVTLKEAARLSGIAQRGLVLLMRTRHLPYLQCGLSVWIRAADVRRLKRRR